jgi:hypothetical protein
MTRLYIAIRGELQLNETPASNARRLYSDPSCAARWARIANDANPGRVLEVDLDECVAIAESEALTAEERLHHAERRATRWLTYREVLEAGVAKGSAPNGDSIWKLRARDLARLLRVFQGWQRYRPHVGGDPPISKNLGMVADRSLYDVLAELLAQIDPADLHNAELR